MIPVFLDEDTTAETIIGILRRAGHRVTTSQEAQLRSQDDRTQLEFAHGIRSVLATKNVADFAQLHDQFMKENREHSGIVLLNGRTPLHILGSQIERAARLLTPDAAASRLLRGEQFATEQLAESTSRSLRP